MSGFNPYNNNNNSNYNDGTGYGNYNGTSAGGFSSQENTTKPQRQNLTQTITPATIRTIKQAKQSSQEGPYESFGMTLYYVTFIGIIREIDASNSASTNYKLEDGTGSISIRQWNNEGEGGADSDQDMDEPEFKSGEYVKVCATIREFNGKKQLQTQSIRKITDYNEVPYHFLSAVKAFIDHRDAPKNDDGDVSMNSSSLFVGENGDGADNKSKNDDNLPITEKLFRFIKTNSNSMVEGVPAQMMAQEFNMPVETVKDNLTSLVDDGRIFATDDESMFLCV
ncbi:hypothetical protein FOA43_004068 [Brettanomyces nanus]|uniref:Uncharacterized protein n=1 Tax=Eeniella nana TaxID=13502 RepID=A0A875SD66_EENNA|nr:uncharacterized protein FOA43_004068 [Brettanomyces nanus]QPG76674.1 hypothetical protein FOA43_004068 [Brettanomyces nanus]